MFRPSDGRAPSPFPAASAQENFREHDLWLLTSRARLWLLAALFALVMFFANYALDRFLLHQKDSPYRTAEISDALSGVVAGLLFFKVLEYDRERRRRMLERLRTIGDMNHHIRNALQVISYSAYSTPQREEEVARIKEAVDRIEWALREVLPKLGPPPGNDSVPHTTVNEPWRRKSAR